MIPPALALFAIEAGVRLGRKINEVLVDETAQRPLLMPLGDLFGSVTEAEAMHFFAVEQPELIAPNGTCFALRNNRPKLILVYRAMRGVEGQFGAPVVDVNAKRREIVGHLSALDQFDQKFEAGNPARRILGTVVEIGVDYFAAHPEAMGRDSSARKIVHAFVSGLQETDFAEGSARDILGDLLGSALRTVGENAALIDDDRRLAVLLGGVTGAVAEDLKNAVKTEDEVARHQLFRRVGTSLLRGTTSAFVGEIGLFMPETGVAKALVQGTLTQVLKGIEGQEDLFTNDTLELIVKSALRATSENATLLSDTQGLQELIQRTTGVLADRQWDTLFSSATAGAVLHEVLEVTRENVETLIKPGQPQTQFLAQALSAMAGSLSSKLAGGGSIQDLLSRRQVLDLTRLVLNEVARSPELMLGDAKGDPKQTVLAQVIGSVAKALGDDPTLVTHGQGVIQITEIALRVALNNADTLIDTSKLNPSTNRLYKILRDVVITLSTEKDPRKLLTRPVFLDVVGRVLPLISSNVAALDKSPKIIGEVIAGVLALSRGELEGRIDGANLGFLIEEVLRRVVWDKLDMADAVKLRDTALLILQTA